MFGNSLNTDLTGKKLTVMMRSSKWKKKDS